MGKNTKTSNRHDMERSTITSQSWDDLVFENRNHAYGAYVMRKSYSASLSRAMGGTLAFASLIVLVPLLGSYLTGSPVVRLVPPIVMPTIKLDPMPAIERIARSPKPPATVTRAVAPVVTRQEVPDEFKAPESDNVNEPVNSAPGVETAAIGNGLIDAGSVSAPVVPSVYDVAEVMPQYKGGLDAMAKFFYKNLKYPRQARSIGTEGTVYVQFVVSADGRVTDVIVVRGISSDCNAEAARIVSKMNAWTPGMQHHVPVAVRMVLPIKFKLTD